MEALRSRTGAAHPINVAFGGRGTLLDVISELEEILGRTLDVAHSAPRPGDVRDSRADVTKMRDVFPEVSATSLSLGLRETVGWYQRELERTTP